MSFSIKGCVEEPTSCLLADDVMKKHWQISANTQQGENFAPWPYELSQ